ncbi:MAG: helix-turn-helix domain-containing protein [Oscillospiraceae bacterium]|nr:helix-turn-helix domain-containing protein [Oscillospiraceae bacterium]
MKEKHTTESSECITLRVEDTAKILGISLSAAYNMVDRAYKSGGPFHVIKIGRSFRIMKESFYHFLDCGEGA